MNRHIRGKLSDLVKINEQFARSTRIDSDRIEQSGFIYSESIDTFLRTLIKHQHSSKQSAYTWTGPYGSGKSTLALSLNSVLQGNAEARSSAARAYTRETAEKLWEAFPPEEKGWEIISLVGGKGKLEDLMKNAFISKGILNLEDINKNDQDLQLQQLMIAAIENYTSARKDYGGIILFVDEMGKLLEAASEGFGDVYFYQLLAEAATRSNGRFVIIGILHQSFQEYANSPIKRVRDEWGKIHGRFVDISINLSSSEQLELIASTLSSTSENEKCKELSKDTIRLLSDLKRAPSQNLGNLLNRCWPLNPLTAISIGPISKRSYGQNQRSIFNFLASGEPLALKDFITRISIDDNALYSLPDLWDYLDVNWGTSIAVSSDSHHFANVKDALSRLDSFEDVKPIHAEILKSISILELSSQMTGINASNHALRIALGQKNSNKITSAIKYLTERSLIIFKKYKNSYALYEGSDFDIEDELAKALKNTPQLSLSKIAGDFLQKEIVAKRHYLQTGSLRWAEMALCTPEEVKGILDSFQYTPSNFALFLIVSSEDENAVSEINEKYKASTKNVIFGRNVLHNDMFEFFSEYYALKEISHNSSALQKDKVARREINDRIEAIYEIINTKFADIIERTEWFHKETARKVLSLSKLASDTADEIYSESPIIQNELINRSRPSGSANAALKSLLYAMIKNEASKNLGFQKFPAERGLYESILKKNNLHAVEDGIYRLQNPFSMSEINDAGRLKPLWKSSIEFLKENSQRKVPLSELQERWQLPPFGVKKGLFPILSSLFYFSNKETLAYYRDEIFVTDFQDFDIDYFFRTPQLVELRWLDMDAQKKRLLSALASIPAELNNSKIVSIEPLEVARSLVAVYDDIETWAKKTNIVSENAKKVRTLFKRASDPAQFTLNDLPAIYGEVDLKSKSNLDNLVSKIKDGLEELRTKFSGVIRNFKSHILAELGVPPGWSSSSIEELNQRAVKIRGISGENRMESFIFQLSQITLDDSDFEKLAWLILSKPTKSWIDQDVDKLLVEATRFSREFRNLETMASIKDREETSYSFAIVNHSKGRGANKPPRIFEVNENELASAKLFAEKLKKLNKSDDVKLSNKTILATLSILSDEMEND